MSVRFSLPPSLPLSPYFSLSPHFSPISTYVVVSDSRPMRKTDEDASTEHENSRVKDRVTRFVRLEIRASTTILDEQLRYSIVLSSSFSSLLLAIQRRCFIATCDDLRSTILASEEPDRSTQVHVRSYRNVLSRVLSGFRDGPRNEIVFLKSCLL